MLHECLAEYHQHLKVLNTSRATANGYISRLGFFFKMMKVRDLRGLTKEKVDFLIWKFRVLLSESLNAFGEQFSDKTVKEYCYVVRRFFGWLSAQVGFQHLASRTRDDLRDQAIRAFI